MKRTKAIFAAWGLVALMAACVQKESEKPLPDPTSEGKLNREQLLEGDSTIYGLACEGCNDSVVILLPGDGSDPVTYNIIDAHRHNRVMGRLKVGDWIGLMRNPTDSTVADFVLNLDELKGTWCYVVMPKWRDATNMTPQAQAILELFHHEDVTEDVSEEIKNDLTDEDKDIQDYPVKVDQLNLYLKGETE